MAGHPIPARTSTPAHEVQAPGTPVGAIMGDHEPQPSVALSPAIVQEHLQSETGRRAACFGTRIEFAPSARLAQNRYATIRVAAQADNLHSGPNFLAVVAAVLLLFEGKAGAAQIRAFLWIRRKAPHIPPLPVSPAAARSCARIRRRYRPKNSSANLYALTSKIDHTFGDQQAAKRALTAPRESTQTKTGRRVRLQPSAVRVSSNLNPKPLALSM